MVFNPWSDNRTKCSNALKQFVGKLRVFCLHELLECVWPFCGVGAWRVKWYNSNYLDKQSKVVDISTNTSDHFFHLTRLRWKLPLHRKQSISGYNCLFEAKLWPNIFLINIWQKCVTLIFLNKTKLKIRPGP